MTIDCDRCTPGWDNAPGWYEQRTVDDQVDKSLFVLGIFNGRAYTYSEIDGKTVIMAVAVNPDLSQKTTRIGKFELPDRAPSDVITSDGTVGSIGDGDHGEG